MQNKLGVALAKTIKQYRKASGVTQKTLSQRSKITYKYIQAIESKRPPDIKLSTLGRIAKALGVAPWRMLHE